MAKKLTYFYLLPITAVLFLGSIASLFRTTCFELYMKNELPSYQNDAPLALAVLLAVVCAGLYWVNSYLALKSIKLTAVCLFSCGWAVLASLFFVLLFRCGAVCDSGFLSEYAVAFMDGNYEAFGRGSYLHHYPFQLGMTAFLEVVYRLFGAENYLAFQMINVVSIAGIIFLLQKITWELFEDGRIVLWEGVLSMGMLPLFLYATFVYGDIVGLALGIGAVYCGICFLKRGKWRYIFIAGAAFFFGIAVKSNDDVFLAAFVIILLLKMVQERKLGFRLLLGILGVVALSQAGMPVVESVYTRRAGIERVWEGTPKAAWIAMGLQEADESYNGCGWYNGYNMDIYRDNNFDNEKTKEACIQNIGESLRRFGRNPGDMVYFFYRKFVSQWNDPTFQSLMMNEWYSRYTQGKTALADFFLYGAGRQILLWLMNFYHLLFLVSATAGCIFIIRDWRLERAYLLLNVFGGFFFHMIWEAKSRYILGYFVLLLPVAGAGLVRILGGGHGRWQKKNSAMGKAGGADFNKSVDASGILGRDVEKKL